ncbi:Polyprenol-phosphate-mannose-dependent alpha-(1-2)-phosphatidylinositol mannoside mannosyltransferase [Burkholderia sp. 8Y]|uniref:glycosyltransferase family 87 protein n=1 Tax=Burkholderia sp. 8Y TaxID=2653133 RepID=UPI0012F32B5F|nr:glycosyltransferase family 87 protein [Burkholderia sp. 8Y]VXC92356.1 Polyprenol-phosphate-mannose-dependent alpha-(1-2)-phosphatidylinositol mannoside mannosyltransferase [Burkholderia sp. 8Y]
MFKSRMNWRAGIDVRMLSALLAFVALCFLAIRVVIIYHLFFRNPVRSPDILSDFNLFYYAFNVVLHSPNQASLLYDNARLAAFLAAMGSDASGFGVFYCYPPQFALIFSPLGLLSPLTAKLVWVSASFVLCAIGAVLLAKMSYRGADRRAIIMLVAMTLLSYPVLHDAYLAQSNELLFFLLATTFFLIERDRRYAAGVFLGLAIVFKVTPLAILGLLVLRFEWRTAMSTIVCAGVLTLVTAFKLGFNVIRHFFLFDIFRAQEQIATVGGLPGNGALRAALQTAVQSVGMPASESVLHWSANIFALMVCALSSYLIFRRSRDTRIDYALASMTILVASPVIEPIHMVIALIPLVILIGTAMERPAVRLSAIAPGAEIVVTAIAVLLLYFLERSATYFVAAMLTYALCVARYFPAAFSRSRDATALPDARAA